MPERSILDGQKIEIGNPDEAMKYGVAMVHQELQPVPARSVAENMYLGRFPVKKFGPLQVIDHKTMNEETAKWLKEVRMDFDPKALLGSLVHWTDAVCRNCKSSIPERQRLLSWMSRPLHCLITK